MIFEVINPSDKYTIETDSWDVACLACLILGKGQYALEEIGGKYYMPFFIMGGLEEWIEDEFDVDLMQFMKNTKKKQAEIIDCLNSIVIGDRDAYTRGLESLSGEDAAQNAFKTAWRDSHRSSLNDIGTYAKNYAAKMREIMESNNGSD